MINVTALDNVATDSNGQTAYQRYRFDLISTFEAVKPAAYLDTKRIPTIGIGFNLQDDNILKLVLNSFGIKTSSPSTTLTTFHGIAAQSYASNAALQTALNAEMVKQHNANTAIRSTFAFASGDAGLAEMRAVFDTAVQIYDEGYPNATATTDKLGRVNAWLAGIPDSYERAVLVLLSYNGLINAGTASSLRAAVLSGDRAEAWYQIRYDSNKLARHYLTGTDLGKDGTQADADAQGNPIGTAQPYEDIPLGSAGNDHILSGELNDDIGSGGHGSDLYGGAGNVANDFEWRDAA